jgi:hypothetical protein
MHEPAPTNHTLPIIGLISGWGSPLIAWLANLDAALRTGCLALGFLISLSSLLLMWFPGIRPRQRPADRQDPPTPPPA